MSSASHKVSVERGCSPPQPSPPYGGDQTSEKFVASYKCQLSMTGVFKSPLFTETEQVACPFRVWYSVGKANLAVNIFWIRK